jgi:hypothetical protein
MADSVFLTTNHLFLRDPHGGVEDVAAMATAGFRSIFCNIGDFDPLEWATIRARAGAAGVACGPWLRTADEQNRFDRARFQRLLDVADMWEQPLIVNAESELQGTGDTVTTYINEQLGSRDAAISMEPWPFDNVQWWPLANRPMMPQMASSVGNFDEAVLREIWQAYGINCVVLTFGSFGGSTPANYDLLSPYGIYTADDCGGRYGEWSQRGTCVPCLSTTPEDPMGQIGSQHGITAMFNRLRTLDPAGSLVKPDATGKYPKDPLAQLDGVPLDQWKAYDKAERALTILVEDHDSAL